MVRDLDYDNLERVDDMEDKNKRLPSRDNVHAVDQGNKVPDKLRLSRALQSAEGMPLPLLPFPITGAAVDGLLAEKKERDDVKHTKLQQVCSVSTDLRPDDDQGGRSFNTEEEICKDDQLAKWLKVLEQVESSTAARIRNERRSGLVFSDHEGPQNFVHSAAEARLWYPMAARRAGHTDKVKLKKLHSEEGIQQLQQWRKILSEEPAIRSTETRTKAAQASQEGVIRLNQAAIEESVSENRKKDKRQDYQVQMSVHQQQALAAGSKKKPQSAPRCGNTAWVDAMSPEKAEHLIDQGYSMQYGTLEKLITRAQMKENPRDYSAELRHCRRQAGAALCQRKDYAMKVVSAPTGLTYRWFGSGKSGDMSLDMIRGFLRLSPRSSEQEVHEAATFATVMPRIVHATSGDVAALICRCSNNLEMEDSEYISGAYYKAQMDRVLSGDLTTRPAREDEDLGALCDVCMIPYEVHLAKVLVNERARLQAEFGLTVEAFVK